MTELLQTALDEISKLSESEQDALAIWILEGLESERRWTEKFAASEDLLSQLADDALAEYLAGKTIPLDTDNL